MIALLLLIPTLTLASWRSSVRAGDKAYDKQQYDQALVKYLEGLGAKGDSNLIHFDLGNVLHAQEKFDDAGKFFQASLLNPDSLTRADALYNLGNALVGAQKYPEALAAYKSALKLRPRQMDYLQNLQLAQALMKKQQQQQQDKDEKDEKDQQDQKDKQDQQDQQQQEDQQSEQNKDKQDQQQQQQQNQQDQQSQEQQQQQQAMADSLMSRQDAERLLNALQYNEQQVQENLHRQPATDVGVDKDW